MRKLIFAVLLALLVVPASAQDWGSYGNSRYGYQIGVPPEYLGQGESGNGDGQEFQKRRGAQRLTVWGGMLGVVSDNFEAEVTARMQDATASGWKLTYQVTTGQWASFSAIKGARVLYQRMILLCDRQSYATFRLEYSQRYLANMDTVVSRLVGSLQQVC